MSKKKGKKKTLIYIEEIKVPKRFKRTTPSPKKVEKVRKYYQEHGKLDKDIVINRDGYIIDGYIRYLVIREVDNVDFVSVVVVNDGTHRYEKEPEGEITYVYGVHDTSPKEYVWKITRNTGNSTEICPGCRAFVHTVHGKQKITVTRVEKGDKPPVSGKIRSVVRCCKS